MRAELLVGVLLLGLTVSAAASFGPPPNAREILREQRAIQAETEGVTGAYSRLNPAAKERLTHAQGKVFRLLDGKSTVEHLNELQKVELFNALQEVQAILDDNEKDRLICKRERKVGTAIRETRCATVAQREELEKGAREWLGPKTCSAGFEPGTDCGGNVR